MLTRYLRGLSVIWTVVNASLLSPGHPDCFGARCRCGSPNLSHFPLMPSDVVAYIGAQWLSGAERIDKPTRPIYLRVLPDSRLHDARYR